jgi:Raf kinase inhibitor-like YbhB/YbcL family protein
MDDPDVPKNLKPDGLFVHWVVYNMPANTSAIVENSTPPGERGLNSAGKLEYAAPCPPDREHRYFFKLYALDTMLNFNLPPAKDVLELAMAGHIIAQAELVGRYIRR